MYDRQRIHFESLNMVLHLQVCKNFADFEKL